MAIKDIKRPDEATLQLIRDCASRDQNVATAAQRKLAIALETPLRQGVLHGPNTDGIFERRMLEAGAELEFPLDLLAPGEEDDFVAFTQNGHGYIPERTVESDYVKIPTYAVANAIDWLMKYARDARWDIIGRSMQILEAGFVRKMNDDAWATILSAGADRNALIYDADATAGQFTKRLVSLLKTNFRRLGGGNSTSMNRAKLTDLYVSLEAVEDVRNWSLAEVDDITRREIYTAGDEGPEVTRVFGVNLVALDELGEGQQYQDFYTNQLGAVLQTSDVELVVGIDRSANDSFIMPIRQEVTIYEDTTLLRQLRQGYFATAEYGVAVLDTRRVIVGSF